MVKIGYSGNMSSFHIKVPSGRINFWKKDEIRDVTEKDAESLLLNKDFYVAGDEPVKKKEVKKEEEKEEKVEKEKEEVQFDFDGDGDFDADDVSLAGKAMAASRYKK